MTSDDLPVARVGTLKSGPSDWSWTWRNVHCAMDAAAPAAPAEDAPPLLLKTSECTPWLVRDVLLAKGWREWVEGADADDAWALCWRSGKYRPSEYVEAHRRGQRVNHFRNSGAITKKDSLLRHLRQCRAVHGAVYAFFPPGFILPTEYTKFVAEHTAASAASPRDGRPPPTWICKPADSSRGRGIYLLRELDELSYAEPTIAQRYIERPLLIGGYKFDMRLYVLVTSFHPLEIWMNADGIARFGTEKCEHRTRAARARARPARSPRGDEQR